MSLTGRLHSMASGSFRDAKLERPVSGAELRRLLVASRPAAAIRLNWKQTIILRNGSLGSTFIHYPTNYMLLINWAVPA